MTQDTSTKITIHDLPAKVHIPLPEEPDTTASTIFTYIGYGVFIIGVLFIFFGPDKIYYNRYEGMSFIQFLQAYPGPIASVGALLAGLASRGANSSHANHQKEISMLIDDAVDIKDEDIPHGHKLHMEATDEENVFLFSLIEDKTQPEATPDVPQPESENPAVEKSGTPAD